ncbi:hypothetical protein [Pseudorhodoferax sp.]|uniref:hypothetical protein n=1 Tax=Pseudorhodoferax sp. TaxID=1993553 RepID=UPI0039E4807C
MSIVSWFAHLFQGWAASAAASAGQAPREAASSDVAFGLLESAHRCAGHDPFEARRLRSAALAWLSVVR